MKKIRAAAYCRVSTEKDTQDGSYELQESYFTNLIQSNPDMELVGIYGDKGKSGLHVAGRPGLQKLLEDCRAGRIDRIITKSISRFARNVSECAETIRELRSLGIHVFFEKEKLNTEDGKCDLVLYIYAAIAQEESNSISQNSIRSHEQYALEGRPFGAISFGYRNVGDNRWGINEEEAPRVRKAFEMALQGNSFTEILTALNQMETGYTWKQRRLKYMLTNPVYKGDYYSHATVCLVTGKQVPNRNYRDRIYIKGHHAPIVSPDDFDAVQKIIERGILNSSKRLTEEDRDFLKGVNRIASSNESNENRNCKAAS